MYMSSILPVGEFPIITSKIDIDTKLLSKKISETEEKKSSEYTSKESIQIGDGVPVTTSNLPNTQDQDQTIVQNSEPNYTLTIIMIIIFLLLAGASYYFYIKYKKK